MSNSILHPSRDKYLSLLKQTTSIDFVIVTSDDLTESESIVREVASGDKVILKNNEFTSFQRAQRRNQLVASRQQNNLEKIFSLALEYINQDAQFDRLDLDWMMKFTELAKNCYSQTMHELWARIIAVELSKIGTFSYKSLKVLSELSTKEALLFYKAVNLTSRIGEDKSAKILTGVYKKPTFMSIFSNNNRKTINLNKFGLSYPQIISLAEIGLIYEQEIESAPYLHKESIHLSYVGKSYQLRVKQKEVILTYYKLTQTGNELCKLITTEFNKGYLNSLLSDFNSLLDITSNTDSLV
ncbi:TIGR03899 family protein [Psychrosphaera aquimarina]|uniref:TIGR03899 family protein n=1 Tax=Psychrosphaera aquimarina TaxID=2044854 RepID=A0ABU3QX86_9GAMM|nr:TIGR03899 family protein [Psychrosphaera aquimarina]MDU0112052.1 TIGR03899 family protein [Psychrosphaera aquimarina]